MAASYLGIDDGFTGFQQFVVSLNERLSIPENLTALGIVEPDLDAIIAGAFKDPSVGGNPVEMTAENTRSLLEACF